MAVCAVARLKSVALPAEGVDRNIIQFLDKATELERVALPAEGVDRNILQNA